MILMNSFASDTDEEQLEDRIIIDQYEEMFKNDKNIMDIAMKIWLILLVRVILREGLLRLRMEMIDWLRRY